MSSPAGRAVGGWLGSYARWPARSWARRPTCGAALLAVAQRRGPEAPQPETLGPLLARRVAGLVGVPQLLAVVAELCAAALAAARELRAAGAAKRYDSVAGGGGTAVGKGAVF